jgi:CRP/FNR family cyclic AMP-dependent transcriptional regulator
MVDKHLSPIFNKQLRYLFEEKSSKRYTKREYIYSPKDIANQIFYIKKGAVRVFEYVGEVKRTRFILYPEDIFGTEGFFGQQQYELYAEVLSDTLEIKVLDNSSLQKKLMADNEYCLEFIRYLEYQRKFWFNRFVAKSSQQSEALVILYLEGLAEKVGQQIGVEVLISIIPKHQDIADILGISRQTVSSTLFKLKEKNQIYYDRKRLIIRDLNGKIAYEK